MYKETILDNGLRIITNDNNNSTVTLSYVIKAGFYDEHKDNLGISHFVEHMLFKGTTSRSSYDISRDIESIGGILNAETSFEHTRYHCTTADKYWKKNAEIISDIIWNNTIPNDEFQKEKKVILEELKMYNDNPSSRVFDLLLETMHQNCISRQTMGGKIDTVKRITREQMIDFIDKYYIPKNMVIVGTGNIKHDELVSFIKKYISFVDFKEFNVRNRLDFEPERLIDRDKIEKKDIVQSHLAWGCFGSKANSNDFIIEDIVGALLGGNSSSILYQRIRENEGLCYSIYVHNIALSDVSIINGYVGLDQKYIPKVKEIILDELNNLKIKKINDLKLKQIKNYLKGTMTISLETTRSYNKFITNSIINKSENTVEEYFDKIDSVTVDDVQRFAKKYFRDDNICFTQIIPR